MTIQQKLQKSNQRLKHLLSIKRQRDSQQRQHKYVIFAYEYGFDTSKYSDMGDRIGAYTSSTITFYYANPKLTSKNDDLAQSIDSNKILFTKKQADQFIKKFPSPELVKHNVIPISVAMKTDKTDKKA